MIYRLTWLLCRFVFRFVLRWQVRGAENVPAAGPVIIASNHASNLDPPVVAVAVWRPCYFMAKQELFTNRMFNWYIRCLGAFPVRRGTADRAALKRSLELLEQGRALVMFPEGTRSETGELKEPELGVGMIACRTGIAVVPVYLQGTSRVMPKGGGFRLARIVVTFGPPLRFGEQGTKPGRQDYERAAARIMEAIAALRGPANG